jgi:hypothetical protein
MGKWPSGQMAISEVDLQYPIQIQYTATNVLKNFFKHLRKLQKLKKNISLKFFLESSQIVKQF